MAIACAYCNSEHATPAEVRQCWQDGGQPDVPVADDDMPPLPAFTDEPAPRFEPADTPARTSRPASRPAAGPVARPTTAEVPRGVAPAGAGPSALGRHLIIEPGGEVPPPWTEAERLVVDAATLVEPHHALTTLRRAHHARERLVIELAASFERAPQLMTEAPPEELGPTFAFDREELHHLVWSNSVDHRDPARPTWIALDAAIHGGASAADGARPTWCSPTARPCGSMPAPSATPTPSTGCP